MMAFSAALGSAASSRMSAGNLPRCPAPVAGTPRALNVCYARPGYDQETRPTRRTPSSGGWGDEYAGDEAASAPRSYGAAPQSRQPGGYNSGSGQDDGYRTQRRQYNNNNAQDRPYQGGEGNTQDRPQRRQYTNYNNNNQEGGEGGQQRRPYNNNNNYNNNNRYNNQEGGGGRYRQYEGQAQEGGEERRQWGGPRQGLTPEQLAAREEVKSALREAYGWRALAAVMAEKGPQLDAENISFIFSKVAKEKRPENPQDAADYDQLLSTLLGWVLSLRPTFRPRQTAMCLSTLGKLQLYSPEVVEALMDHAANQMVNFNDTELYQVVTGCGMLGHTPTPAFLQEFETRTTPALARFKITDLVGIMSALHRLNVLPVGRPWLDSAMAALEAQCLQLPVTQDAAKAIQRPRYDRNASAQEGDAPPQRPRYNNYQSRDPHDILLSEYMDTCMLLANIAQDTGYQAPQSLVDALMSRQIWRVAFPPLDMATRLLWVVSNLTARPSREWFNALMTGLERKDKLWVPEDVGNICLYLSRYLQQQATPNLARKLWRFAETEKQKMGADGVASVLYFLAMSGYKPQERWLDDVLIWLKPELPNCTLTGLELIYNSLPLLGSGFRLNEVLTEAANRYNAGVEGQQQAAEGQDGTQALEAAVA